MVTIPWPACLQLFGLVPSVHILLLSRAAALVDWLRGRGAFVSEAIECSAEASRGIGLRARRTVAQFEVLAKIPLRLCIYEALPPSCDGPTGAETRWNLIEKLMHVKQQKGRAHYHPYIVTLPNKLNRLPLYWDSDAMESIQGTSLEIMCSTENRLLHRLFTDFYKVRYSKSEYELFRWATGIVKSRVKVMADYAALVPLLDLVNHEDLYDSTWGSRGCVIVLDEDRQSSTSELCYHLVALTDIQSDEEIVVDYSLLSFQNKIAEYGIIDTRSNVLEKYYTLALENFSDRGNPMLINVRRTNLSNAFFELISDGLNETYVRRSLQERESTLEKICASPDPCTIECRFIRETDLFYTKHCLQNLSKIFSREGLFECQTTEEYENSQKMEFMTRFYQHTGLKIEI